MSAFSAIVGMSTVIRHVQHLILRVAEMEAPVLISGESGTGKELVARAIHEKSSRYSGPFIVVKCAAVGEDLLEAELFGHEREAFPGAQGRQGRIEVASGGIIYLDEVSKLSPRLQISLLRLLQEGVIYPVGSSAPIQVNVRIICSSSVPLDELVKDRVFREDLYYRLSSCSIFVPPLRDRREDIPTLVETFIQKYNQLRNKSIVALAPDALTALLQHTWPSNVRELENLVERIVVLKNNGTIEVCDLPPRIRSLVTDNIDNFYEKNNGNNNQAKKEPLKNQQPQQPMQQNTLQRQANNSGSMSQTQNNMRSMRDIPTNTTSNINNNLVMNRPMVSNQQMGQGFNQPMGMSKNPNFDDPLEIDTFIRKEIDLGNGIDFYRVVEEFENRLISEALRRTNHNKNRAAQLLSMNRTTLVEKLKKRTTATPSKPEPSRSKKNSGYTIFDGLGTQNMSFESYDFVQDKTDDLLDAE